MPVVGQKGQNPGGRFEASHPKVYPDNYRLQDREWTPTFFRLWPMLSFAEFERAISVPRAARYLEATRTAQGETDPVAAIALYERNSELGAAAWTVIADVEVVLRNAIATAISDLHARQRPGSLLRWYDNDPTWVNFSGGTLSVIKNAKSKIKDPGPAGPRPKPDRLIAECSLGFWRFLLVAAHEHTLWNPAIRAKFTALGHLSGSDSRKEVHRRVEELNYLRNRIGHHEPIYEPFAIPNRSVNLPDVIAEAIEMISWCDPKVAGWISSR